MKVLDISNIAIGNFDLVHKAVGVLLHDTGFMRYKKLTPENYYYWWYEVDDKRKIDKKKFTYDWADMDLTRNFSFLFSLIKYHNQNETIYKIINNALNLLCARGDGINLKTGRRVYDEVWDMYYRNRKPETKQLELF
jgi:hypothetical protein